MDKAYIKCETLCGVPVVAFEDIEKAYPPDKFKMLIGIGYKDMNSLRELKFNQAKEKAYKMFTFIHPDANVDESSVIGEGSIILRGANIDYRAKIGRNVLIEAGCNISHDTIVFDHCYVSPGVTVGGNAVIKNNCFIGLNATVRSAVTLQPFTVIGAGAYIDKSTEEYGVYVPSRCVKLDKSSKDINLFYKKRDKKKVMVICGGEHQRILVKKVKELGHLVYNTNLYENSPTFEYADKTGVMNVLDFDSNLKFAKENSVDAVITDQSEISIRTVAYVAEKMGLAGISYNNSRLFTDKYLMREFCKKNGFAHPRYGIFNDVKSAVEFFEKLNCKAIIKPVDSFSSMGVYVVNTKEDIETHFNDVIGCTRYNKSVIVEEYIEGQEFTVDGIFVNGKHYTLAISKKYPYKHNSSLVVRQDFAYADDEFDFDLLRKTNDEVLNATGTLMGLTHCEYKYMNGTYYLIEFTARGGGVFVGSKIVPYVSGVDNYRILIESALNRCSEDTPYQINTAIEKNKEKVAGLCFFDMDSKGKPVKKIYGEALLKKTFDDGNLLDFKIDFKVGDIIEKPKDGNTRCGHFIAVSDNQDKLNDLIEKLYKEVYIEY